MYIPRIGRWSCGMQGPCCGGHSCARFETVIRACGTQTATPPCRYVSKNKNRPVSACICIRSTLTEARLVGTGKINPRRSACGEHSSRGASFRRSSSPITCRVGPPALSASKAMSKFTTVCRSNKNEAQQQRVVTSNQHSRESHTRSLYLAPADGLVRTEYRPSLPARYGAPFPSHPDPTRRCEHGRRPDRRSPPDSSSSAGRVLAVIKEPPPRALARQQTDG